MSDALPPSEVHKRTGFQPIWIIPIIAALIAAFLGWRAIEARGPTITITFNTADGMQAGQTKVRHKAVDLGTVKTVVLADDMSKVKVEIEMQRTASRYLTSNARFWVVRPRIGFGGVSGLDTLLSGAYIELDPGSLEGSSQHDFTGLEEPPAIRSGEPGRTFTLTTPSIGAISSGSPIFYRNLTVGEVLGYELDPAGKQFTVHTFIRDPYSKFVHEESQFWNASGITLDFGSGGVKFQIESLRAIIAGGVAFDTFDTAPPSPEAAEKHSFELRASAANATSASLTRRVPVVTHFDSSVSGLAVDAAVQLFGIQVGTVKDIQLKFDPKGIALPYVSVRMDIEMGRVFRDRVVPEDQVPRVVRALVAKGLRASLQSANLLTGQMLVSLEFVPDAPPADIAVEDGMFVLPSVGGGIANITTNLSQITKALAALPLVQIADNLNNTLKGASAIANSKDLHDALQSMSSLMNSAQDVVRKVNNGITPALKQLPEIAQGLQSTIERTNKLIGSADTGYGANSQFKRDLDRLMGQLSDTARSLRILADYLDQNPSALIRGRN
jgi:paraquat-inducible protein B